MLVMSCNMAVVMLSLPNGHRYPKSATATRTGVSSVGNQTGSTSISRTIARIIGAVRVAVKGVTEDDGMRETDVKAEVTPPSSFRFEIPHSECDFVVEIAGVRDCVADCRIAFVIVKPLPLAGTCEQVDEKLDVGCGDPVATVSDTDDCRTIWASVSDCFPSIVLLMNERRERVDVLSTLEGARLTCVFVRDDVR